MTVSNVSPHFRSAPGETTQATPPVTVVFGLLNSYLVARSIHVAAQLGVADVLQDGPKAVADIAAAVGAHPDSLYRLLRALVSVGVFTEVEPGSFALTPLGNCLREDTVPSLRSYARLFGSDIWLQTFDHFLEVVQTGRPGFDLAHGMPRYAYLDQHPELGSLYNQAMGDISSVQIPALLAAYDFSGIQSIVDVGGGQGGLLAAILVANPHTTGMLFDRPQVAEEARAKIEAAGLAGRCRVVSGDMFKEVPEGGDAYIVKHVFMELDDAEAEVLLWNLRRAIRGGGRLLVIDPVIPAGNEPSPNTMADLAMLLLSPAGRSRTPAEFHNLFETAGFVPGRVIPTPPLTSIVEAIPRT